MFFDPLMYNPFLSGWLRRSQFEVAGRRERQKILYFFCWIYLESVRRMWRSQCNRISYHWRRRW